jgi:hypothetical protein
MYAKSKNYSTRWGQEPHVSSVSRFKGMSWIDIVIMVEEEEEVARELAIRKSIAERKVLIAKGEYELEEGEEIEEN